MGLLVDDHAMVLPQSISCAESSILARRARHGKVEIIISKILCCERCTWCVSVVARDRNSSLSLVHYVFVENETYVFGVSVSHAETLESKTT